jgi:hypothetical protein
VDFTAVTWVGGYRIRFPGRRQLYQKQARLFWLAQGLHPKPMPLMGSKNLLWKASQRSLTEQDRVAFLGIRTQTLRFLPGRLSSIGFVVKSKSHCDAANIATMR